MSPGHPSPDTSGGNARSLNLGSSAFSPAAHPGHCTQIRGSVDQFNSDIAILFSQRRFKDAATKILGTFEGRIDVSVLEQIGELLHADWQSERGLLRVQALLGSLHESNHQALFSLMCAFSLAACCDWSNAAKALKSGGAAIENADFFNELNFAVTALVGEVFDEVGKVGYGSGVEFDVNTRSNYRELAAQLLEWNFQAVSKISGDNGAALLSILPRRATVALYQSRQHEAEIDLNNASRISLELADRYPSQSVQALIACDMIRSNLNGNETSQALEYKKRCLEIACCNTQVLAVVDANHLEPLFSKVFSVLIDDDDLGQASSLLSGVEELFGSLTDRCPLLLARVALARAKLYFSMGNPLLASDLVKDTEISVSKSFPGESLGMNRDNLVTLAELNLLMADIEADLSFSEGRSGSGDEVLKRLVHGAAYAREALSIASCGVAHTVGPDAERLFDVFALYLRAEIGIAEHYRSESATSLELIETRLITALRCGLDWLGRNATDGGSISERRNEVAQLSLRASKELVAVLKDYHRPEDLVENLELTLAGISPHSLSNQMVEEYFELMGTLASVYLETGDVAKAHNKFEELFKALEAETAPISADSIRFMTRYGLSLLRRKDLAQATSVAGWIEVAVRSLEVDDRSIGLTKTRNQKVLARAYVAISRTHFELVLREPDHPEHLDRAKSFLKSGVDLAKKLRHYKLAIRAVDHAIDALEGLPVPDHDFLRELRAQRSDFSERI